MALYNTIIGVNSSFWTLSDRQNQMDTFIPLVICGIYVFPNDGDAIKFIRLLPSAQDKQ